MKDRYFLLVVLVCFLPLMSVLTTTLFPYTQDGWTHLAREAAFFKALRDFQIPVRWAGDLNYAYGMPIFNFAFHFPYIAASFFLSLGTGLVWAYKLASFLAFLISGIFMYLFAKEFFRDRKQAFIVAIFYQFFPFHLVDLLVRGSIGEMFAFGFLPMVLYGGTLVWKKTYFAGFILVAFGTAFLALSHLATGMVFIGISILFFLLFGKDRNRRTLSIAAVLIGLGLSCYYWMPAVLEHSYTYGDFFAKDLYKEHFAPIARLLLPNLFNDEKLRVGNVPVQIGIFHLFAIFLALVLLIRKNVSVDKRKLFVFLLVLIGLALFIMESPSRILWEHVSLLRQFQFPWRFLSVIGFASSLLAVSFFSFRFFQRKIIYILLICFVVFSTVVYWYPQLGFTKIDENEYWNYPMTTTYFGETDLIWSAGPKGSYPKEPVEFISGRGTIANFAKQSNRHTFTVDAKTNITLVDHTQYFPGWRVYVDSKSVPIQFQDANWRGEITFAVLKGSHKVIVMFGENQLRLLADGVSVVSLCMLIVAGLVYRKKRYI